MHNLIIIPTYNEAGNIAPIVSQIMALHNDVDLLFIDDNSQDATLVEIESQISLYPDRIHLLQRPGKLGLGSAYVAGFRWGLAHGYEILIQMDADLSHQPKYLKEMIRLLETSDAVIGSRYVPQGGTLNWSPIRKWISRGGSSYSRTILGIQVADLTGGFNGWHRRVLQNMELESLVGGGYVFQVELKYRCLLAGYTLKEFPIVFVERVIGQSKMSLKIMIEAALKVIWLRLRKRWLISKS